MTKKFVTIDPETKEITGLFESPQKYLDNYFEIDEKDSRIKVFLDKIKLVEIK